MPGTAAALVHGEAIATERVDRLLHAVPLREGATRPEALARAERQRRRWATQVVVADELARRACAQHGLAPRLLYEDEAASVEAVSDDAVPPRILTIQAADVADMGSIVATVLAYSPAARALLAHLEGSQVIPDAAVRDYYDRNPDRFLSQAALRRGVDPFAPKDAGGRAPADFLPYAQVREGIERDLRRAAGRRAFFAWLDRARAGVVYAVGYEHPGDPSHQDHEHRH
nr:malonyl CoA-ACP transacylase [Streptomyces jeddahensis]